MTRARMFFDGGCRPEGLEIAVVARGKVQVRRDVGAGDSSDAEWLALILAAEVAAALDAADVEFVGDSALVVHQARGDWPCRRAGLAAHRARFLAAVEGLPRWRVRHVRRGKNLAGIALDRARGGVVMSHHPRITQDGGID